MCKWEGTAVPVCVLCAALLYNNIIIIIIICLFLNRNELLTWFVRLQLAEYQQLFSETFEVSVNDLHVHLK